MAPIRNQNIEITKIVQTTTSMIQTLLPKPFVGEQTIEKKAKKYLDSSHDQMIQKETDGITSPSPLKSPLGEAAAAAAEDLEVTI